MSKLEKEITINNASVSLNKEVKPEKNKDKNELVQSMLDSVSGGWVNAFARFTKRF